ncbi:UNVERIFIED_CONTAM: hypothetical protein Cloal_3115 [Acetivibrio alkalicellulosi]
MSMLCKCGHVMSDKIVPNKVIYWTYTKENWLQRIKVAKGEFLIVESHAIWNCEKCGRLHYLKNGTRHTYDIEPIELNNVDCLCKVPFSKGDLEEYYSMNDFEMDEIEDKIRKNESYNFPRRVRFCPNCKRVFVQKDDKLKVFCLEELVDLKV